MFPLARGTWRIIFQKCSLKSLHYDLKIMNRRDTGWGFQICLSLSYMIILNAGTFLDGGNERKQGKGRKRTEIFFFFFFFFIICLYRAAPSAYGGSQAGVKSELKLLAYTTASIRTASATHTAAHRNDRSLTYWVMPGIELASSWILVGFVKRRPTHEGNSPKCYS